MTSWTEETTLRIGQAIRTARGGQSAQWLADQCAGLGNAISRTAISEYETGKRKSMPVTDLLTLSAALSIPPLQLLFPDLPFGEVEVLPGVVERSVDAALWAGGWRGLAQFADGDQAHADQLANLSRLSKSNELASDENWLEEAREQLSKAKTDEERDLWVSRVLDKEKSIAQLKIRLGLEPPPPQSEEQKRRQREHYERSLARIEERRKAREDPSDA